MSGVFLKVFNMSVTAGWLILAVLILRFLFKKAPKWITCMFWAIVAVRLICPVSFESVFSVVPSVETVNVSTENASPYIKSGVKILDSAANTYFAAKNSKVNVSNDNISNVNSNNGNAQIQEANNSELKTSELKNSELKSSEINKSGINNTDSNNVDLHTKESKIKVNLMTILAISWIAGVVILLMYGFVSFIRLRKTVSASIVVRDNIYMCDDIRFPFILGVFKPMVYLPSVLNDMMQENVLAHELAHLKRHDHWWKPLGYVLLAIHWFNPICWIAYVLFCKDIEMACDEKVIKDMDTESKAEYSQTLLNLSCPKRMISACPVAFGEVGVKERVKGIIKYKKPAYWLVLLGFLCLLAVSVCFLTNPKTVVAEESKVDYEKEMSSKDDNVIDNNITTEEITEDIIGETEQENTSDVTTKEASTTEISTTEEKTEETTEEKVEDKSIYTEDNPGNFVIRYYGKMSAIKDGQYIYYSGTYQDLYRYDTVSQTHEVIADLAEGGGSNLVKYGDDIYLVMRDDINDPHDGTSIICRVSPNGEITQLGHGTDFVIDNDRIYYNNLVASYDESGEIIYDGSKGTYSMTLNGDDVKEEPWVTLSKQTLEDLSGDIISEYGLLTCPEPMAEDGGFWPMNIYFVDNSGESRLVRSASTRMGPYMMLDDYIFYLSYDQDGDQIRRTLSIEKFDGTEHNEIDFGFAAGAF